MLLMSAACSNDSDSTEGAQSGVSAPSAAAPALVGTRWAWVSTQTPVERTEARNPDRYTLQLLADGNARVQFDCNGGGGSYELAENRLTFGPLVATRMACPADTQDHIYMEQLGKITTYFVRDGELFLEMPYDSGTMRFRVARDQD